MKWYVIQCDAVGQFLGLRVNVQWTAFNSFTLITHSLDQVWQ